MHIANDGGQKRTYILRIVGQYVAKAMSDSREEVPLTIEYLKLVDNEPASSLSKLPIHEMAGCEGIFTLLHFKAGCFLPSRHLSLP
ncbi:hypothetical protein DFH29DRAFT_999240 [Suillus ampliporus]|nr:hypothetical protein DFH29DRAFT_999240 [Suillus ampliporus]